MNRHLSFAIDLFCLVFLSFLFFIAFTGSYHLIIPDEGRYAEVAREMLTSGNWITPHLDGVVFLDKPILMYWLEAFAMKIWGVNEFAVRVFPACIGSLGVVLTYLAGRQLFNRRTAIASSLVLMTSLLYFLATHYVDMDLLIAVLVSGALWFFIMAMSVGNDLQRKSYLWVAYIFAALAVLTKGLIGIVFPMMVIGVWILVLNEWRQLKRMCLLSGLGLFLLIVMPWYIMVQIHNPGFFHYFFIFEQFERYVGKGFNMHNPIYFYPLVIIVGMFPWVIFLFQSLLFAGKEIIVHRKAAFKLVFLVLWPLLILIFFSIPKSKIVGYILPVFPPLAMLIGVYFDRYWNELAVKNSLRWALAALCVLAVILVVALMGVSFMPSLTATASRPYLFILAFIVLAFTILCYWMRKQHQHFSKIFFVLLLASVTTGIVGVSAVHTFQLKNQKSLAFIVKRAMTPDTKVAYFYDYSYDVPFYLQHRVYVVLPSWQGAHLREEDNWRSELALGIDEGPSQKTMIDYQQLQQLWNSGQPVLVIVKNWKLHLFKESISENFKQVGQYGNFFVISNQLAHPATSVSPQLPPPESQGSSKQGSLKQ